MGEGNGKLLDTLKIDNEFTKVVDSFCQLKLINNNKGFRQRRSTPQTKIRTVQAMEFPVRLYGSESYNFEKNKLGRVLIVLNFSDGENI